MAKRETVERRGWMPKAKDPVRQGRFDPGAVSYVGYSEDEPPRLIIGIDTEAEFNWSQPFSRTKTSVDSVAELYRAQDIFDRYGIVPTYLVDFAVANSKTAVRTLWELQEAGRCEIGAHLNPWLNPPFDEPVDRFHSYPCNLPAGLELKKLERLTAIIAERFGHNPRVYRAGRYGIGADTGAILEDLGYCVDMSVVPGTCFAETGGLDFRCLDHRPFRFGPTKGLLEVPVSCGYSGWLAGAGKSIFPFISSRTGMRLHFPGVFARLRALERIRLTPEGVSLAELRRLTESLHGIGCRIFSFTFHSPSLAPGNTPYVRDKQELKDFLRTVDRYCDYFVNELGGRASKPIEIFHRIGKVG